MYMYREREKENVFERMRQSKKTYCQFLKCLQIFLCYPLKNPWLAFFGMDFSWYCLAFIRLSVSP